MAMLVGMSSAVNGREERIGEEPVTIGRGSDNVIVLDDPAVSGHHCFVVRDGAKYLLRDLDSTNGTRVNAEAVKEAELKAEDIIGVGAVEFLFKAAPEEDVAHAAPPAADIEVAEGNAAAPDSFGSISPFGARKAEDNRAWWYTFMVLIGLLALAAVVVVFVLLVTTV
jgi:predicted component of type VI protein secretion system